MVMTPLGVLIEQSQKRFLDEHGVELSYADIARRGGKVITRGRVQQLAKDPIKRLPDPQTIDALAIGLGVPSHLVTQCALASAGYPAPELWEAVRTGGNDYGLAAWGLEQQALRKAKEMVEQAGGRVSRAADYALAGPSERLGEPELDRPRGAQDEAAEASQVRPDEDDHPA